MPNLQRAACGIMGIMHVAWGNVVAAANTAACCAICCRDGACLGLPTWGNYSVQLLKALGRLVSVQLQGQCHVHGVLSCPWMVYVGIAWGPRAGHTHRQTLRMQTVLQQACYMSMHHWHCLLSVSFGLMQVAKQGVEAIPEVVCLDPPGPGVVRVGVTLPKRVWTHEAGWQGGPHAVTVLNALKPLGSQSDYPVAAATSMGHAAASSNAANGPGRAAAAAAREEVMALEAMHNNPSAFGLDAAFKALPSILSDPPAPAMQLANPAAAPEGAGLMDVPEEVMRTLLAKYLSPRDLAAVCCTCKNLRTLGSDAVPGLNLQLYPHQVRHQHA